MLAVGWGLRPLHVKSRRRVSVPLWPMPHLTTIDEVPIPAASRSLAILLFLFAGFAADSPSIPDGPTMRLDIVVRDQHGRIVRNLEAPDFRLTEDGTAVPLVGARLVDGGSESGPLVTLLFDPIGSESAQAVRTAADELVAAAGRSNMQLAVYQVDQTLSLLQTFTEDRKAVRTAVQAITGKQRAGKRASAPALGAPGESRQDGTDPDAIARRTVKAAEKMVSENGARPALAALFALAQELESAPGRKAVIYFCQGLPIADSQEEGFRNIVSQANRAHVSIYTVDVDALAISDREQHLREMSAAMQMTAGVGNARGANGAPELTHNIDTTTGTGVMIQRNGKRPSDAADLSSPVLRALATETGAFPAAKAGTLRSLIKRVSEDLGAYYELTYAPHSGMDGAFHTTKVAVNREKLSVQGRDGYFAVPRIMGRPALPYEVPLLAALAQPNAVQTFSHDAAVLRFRSENGDRPAQFITVGVPASELQLSEDPSAGVVRAHLTLIALARDAAGKIVASFGRDVPLQSPARLAAGLKERYLTYTGRFDLAPGAYTLESALRDETTGRTSTRKSPFTVDPVAPGLGISSLSLVREVLSAESVFDQALRVGDKAVVPAADGVVQGGKASTASIFFSVYPKAGSAAPIGLQLEVVRDGKIIVRGPVKLPASDKKAVAQILSVDVSRLTSGPYDLKLLAQQGEGRAEEHLQMMIQEGAAPGPDGEGVEETGVRAPSEAELHTSVPNVDQSRLIEEARQTVLQYSQRLPNFVCTQVTRRQFDDKGRGQWRTIGETAYLLTFHDGQEHYSELAERTRAAQRESAPASNINSTGEFGSLLKQVFEPAVQARFSWIRAERFHGRLVQVFSYAVDAEHSKYRVSFSGGSTFQAPVFSPYRGKVYIDPETSGVRKMSLQTGDLPAEFPVRQVSLALEYDDVSVAGKLYLLPLAVQLEVRLPHKRAVRSDITFRSYQRFTTDSRILSFGTSESKK